MYNSSDSTKIVKVGGATTITTYISLKVNSHAIGEINAVINDPLTRIISTKQMYQLAKRVDQVLDDVFLFRRHGHLKKKPNKNLRLMDRGIKCHIESHLNQRKA